MISISELIFYNVLILKIQLAHLTVSNNDVACKYVMFRKVRPYIAALQLHILGYRRLSMTLNFSPHGLKIASIIVTD